MKSNEITSDVDQQNGGQLQEDGRQQRDRMRRQALEEAKNKQLEKKNKKAARRKARHKKLPVITTSSDDTSSESSPVGTSSSLACCMEYTASSLQVADEPMHKKLPVITTSSDDTSSESSPVGTSSSLACCVEYTASSSQVTDEPMASSNEFDYHNQLELENDDIFSYIDVQKSEAVFTKRTKHSMDVLSDVSFNGQENICTKQFFSLSSTTDCKTLTEHLEVKDRLLSQGNIDQWLLRYNELEFAKKTKAKEEPRDNVTDPKHQDSMMPDSAEITPDAEKRCLKMCLSSVSTELECLKPASISTLPMCEHCCLTDCSFCGDKHVVVPPCNSDTAKLCDTNQSFSKNTDLATYKSEGAHISKCVHSYQPSETGELSCLLKQQLPRQLSLNAGSLQMIKCQLEIILSHCLSQCFTGADLLNENLKHNREIVPYFVSQNLQQSRLQILLTKLLGEAKFSALIGKHYNIFTPLPSRPVLKEITCHIASSQESGSVKKSNAKVSSRFQEQEPQRVCKASDDNVDEHVYKGTRNSCQLETCLEVFQHVHWDKGESPPTNKEQLVPLWHSFDNSELANVDEDVYKCATDNCHSETSWVKVLQQSPPTTKAQLVPPCNSFENRELAKVDEIPQYIEDHSLANVDGTVCKCTTDDCQYRNSWRCMQCRNDDGPPTTILHLGPSCNSFEKSELANIEEVSQNREGHSLTSFDKVVQKCSMGKCQSEKSWIKDLQHIQCENCECPHASKEHLVPFSHNFDNLELANVDLAVDKCIARDCDSEKSFVEELHFIGCANCESPPGTKAQLVPSCNSFEKSKLANVDGGSQNEEDHSLVNVDEMSQNGEDHSSVNVDEMSQNGETQSLTRANGKVESCQEFVDGVDSFSGRNAVSDVWCPIRQEFVPDNWDDDNSELANVDLAVDKCITSDCHSEKSFVEELQFIQCEYCESPPGIKAQLVPSCHSFEKTKIANVDGVSQNGQDHSMVNVDEMSQKGDSCSLVNVDRMFRNGENSLVNVDEMSQNGEDQSLTGTNGNAESCEECVDGVNSFSGRKVVSDVWCPIRQEFVPDNWDDDNSELANIDLAVDKCITSDCDSEKSFVEGLQFIQCENCESPPGTKAQMVPFCNSFEKSKLANVDGVSQNGQDCSLVNIDRMSQNKENSLVNVDEMSQSREDHLLVNVDEMSQNGENHSSVNVDEISQNGENRSSTGANRNADPESCEECVHDVDFFSVRSAVSDVWCPIRQEFVPDNWDDDNSELANVDLAVDKCITSDCDSEKSFVEELQFIQCENCESPPGIKAQLVPSCNSFEKAKLANVDGVSQNGQDHSVNVGEMSQKGDSCSLVNVDRMSQNGEDHSLVNVDEMSQNGEDHSLVNVDRMSQNGEDHSLVNVDEMSQNGEDRSLTGANGNADPESCEECVHDVDSFSVRSAVSDVWCLIRQEFVPDNWDDDNSELANVDLAVDKCIARDCDSEKSFVEELQFIRCANCESPPGTKAQLVPSCNSFEKSKLANVDGVSQNEEDHSLVNVDEMSQSGKDHSMVNVDEMSQNGETQSLTGANGLAESCEECVDSVDYFSEKNVVCDVWCPIRQEFVPDNWDDELLSDEDLGNLTSISEASTEGDINEQQCRKQLLNVEISEQNISCQEMVENILIVCDNKNRQKKTTNTISDVGEDVKGGNYAGNYKVKFSETAAPLLQHKTVMKMQQLGTAKYQNKDQLILKPKIAWQQRADLGPFTEAESNINKDKEWPALVSNQSQTQILHTELLIQRETERNKSNVNVWLTNVSDKSQPQRLPNELLTHTEAETNKSNEKEWPTLVSNQSQTQILHTELFTQRETERNLNNEKVRLTNVSDQSQPQRIHTELLTHTDEERNKSNVNVWLTNVCDKSQPQRLQDDLLTHTQAETNKIIEKEWPTLVSNQSQTQRLHTELFTQREAEGKKSNENVCPSHVSNQSLFQRLHDELLTHTEAETNKSNDKVWLTHDCDESQPQGLQAAELFAHTEAETKKSNEKAWPTRVSDQSQPQRLHNELLTHTEAETNKSNDKVWLTHDCDESQPQGLQAAELLAHTEAETKKSNEKAWPTRVSDQSQPQRLHNELLTHTEAETNKSNDKVWLTHDCDESQPQGLQAAELLAHTEAETKKSNEKAWPTYVSDQAQAQGLQTKLLRQLVKKIFGAQQNSSDKNNFTEGGIMIKAPELNVTDNLLVSSKRNIPADIVNLNEARVLDHDKDELYYKTDIVEDNLLSENFTNPGGAVNSGKDSSSRDMESACVLDHNVHKKLEWIPDSVLKLRTAETNMDHVITGYKHQQKTEFQLDYLTQANSDNVTYVECSANKQIYNSGLPVNNESTVHMISNINNSPGACPTMQPLAHPSPLHVASNNLPTLADLNNFIALAVQKEQERLYLLLCDLQAKVVALMKTCNTRKSSLAGGSDIEDLKNKRSLPGDKELSLEEIETIIDRFVPVVNKCGMSAPEPASTKSVPQNKHGQNSQSTIPLQSDKKEKGVGQRELSDAELDNILKKLRMLDVNDMKAPQTRGQSTSHSSNGSCQGNSLNGNSCFQDLHLQSRLPKCAPARDQKSWVEKTNKLQTPLFQNKKTNKTVSSCKVEADQFIKDPDIPSRNSSDVTWGLQGLQRHLMRTRSQSGNLTMSRANNESFSMGNSLCKSTDEYQTNVPEDDKSKVLYKFFRRRKVKVPDNSLSERENREIEFSNLHPLGFPTEVGHRLPTSKEQSRSFSLSGSAIGDHRKNMVMQKTESSQFNYCLPSKSQRPVITVSKTLPKKTGGESYTKDNW